jgi:RimJ/RimL family protein N-acetyltransferase
MEIRHAEVIDARQIAEVHVASWKVAYRDLLPPADLDQLEVSQFESWRGRRIEAMDRSNSATLVIDDGRVAGFVDVGPTRDEHLDAGEVAELYAIYLDPERWGRGYGRELIVAAEAAMAGLGFGSAMLWVLEDNARARAFYEAAGWRPDGGRQLERIISTDLYEVRYAKTLDPLSSRR